MELAPIEAGSSPGQMKRDTTKSINKRPGVGVSVDNRPGGKVYKVRVYHKGKCLNLGRFSDLLKAQLSYDQAVWAMSCKGAKKMKTNFPIGTFPLDDPEVQQKVEEFMGSLTTGSAGAAAVKVEGGSTHTLQARGGSSPSSSSAGTADVDVAENIADDADNWALCSTYNGAAGEAPGAAVVTAATAAAAADDDAAFKQLLDLVPRGSAQYYSSQLHMLLLEQQQQQQQQQQPQAVDAEAANTTQQQVQPSFVDLLEDDTAHFASDFGPFHMTAGCPRSKSASAAVQPAHNGLNLPECSWPVASRIASCGALQLPSFSRLAMPAATPNPSSQHHAAAHALTTGAGLQALQQQPSLLVQQECKKRRLSLDCDDQVQPANAGTQQRTPASTQQQVEQQQQQQQEQEQQQQELEPNDLELTLSNELLGLGLTHSIGSLMLTNSLELLLGSDPHQQLLLPHQNPSTAVDGVGEAATACQAATAAAPSQQTKAPHHSSCSGPAPGAMSSDGQKGVSSTGAQAVVVASPQPAAVAEPPLDAATAGAAAAPSSAPSAPPAAAPAPAGKSREEALQLIAVSVRGLLDMNVALLGGSEMCALRDALMWLSNYRQKRGSSTSPADRAALQLMGQVVQLLAQEASSSATADNGAGLAAFVERSGALSAVERLVCALTSLNDVIRSTSEPTVRPDLLQAWLSGLQAQSQCPADVVVAHVAAQLQKELVSTA